MARQCNAWSLPYAVSFTDQADVREGRIVNPKLVERLQMLARDTQVYGGLLARQRRADLAANEPGFLACHRPPHTQGRGHISPFNNFRAWIVEW